MPTRAGPVKAANVRSTLHLGSERWHGGSMAGASDQGRRFAPSEMGGVDFTLADPRLTWASAARASSEYSSDYAASSACGPPAVFPESGDREGTWLASSDDRSPWLEVELPDLPQAHSLIVCETCGAGAVHTVTDVDRSVVLHRQDVRVARSKGARLLVIPLEPGAPAPRRVRLDVAPTDADYHEIDSVGLAAVSIDALVADPPRHGPNRHRRYAPGELAVHDLRRDRRLHWAKRAVASSEYSSSYRAADAVGRPNVFPKGGDLERTWLSQNGDRSAWIELEFDLDANTQCHGFVALETCGAGAIVRATDETGRTLWQAGAEIVPERQARLLHVELDPGPPPKKLRLWVSPKISDYREIDAVALLDAPFAELASPAPPPPPPPVPGAPPGGFILADGVLVGASSERPLIHAILRSADAAHAVCHGGPVHLRTSEGSEVAIDLGETTIYGPTLPRRRGRFAELASELPWLTQAFAGRAPAPDVEVVVEGRQITSEAHVHVAAIAAEARPAQGYRDSTSAPARLVATAIADRPLTETPFLREGSREFSVAARRLEAKSDRPHPLRTWTSRSLVVALASIIVAGGLWALALNGAAFDGGAAFGATIALVVALASSVFALELVGRSATVFMIDRRPNGSARNRRVPFVRVAWTLVGTATLVVLPGFFWALMVATTARDASIALRGTLVLGALHALLRITLWMRSAGSALVAARHVVGAAPGSVAPGERGRFTGVLASTHGRTETLKEHAEHLGTESRVDEHGVVTQYDKFRTWYERHTDSRGDQDARVVMADGRTIRSRSAARILDAGLTPRAADDATTYASFASEHGHGDEASVVGTITKHGDEWAVEHGTVLLGALSELRRTSRRQLLALFGLSVILVGGVLAVLVR